MKKVLLTLVAAAFTFTSNAQETAFKAGNFIVEGNLGFNSVNDKQEGEKFSGFNLNPKAAYFLTDKIAVGLSLDFENEVEKYTDSNNKYSNDYFGVNVFGRYYFLELGSRFKTYTELAVGYGVETAEERYYDVTSKAPNVNSFGVNGGIGANYFITDKIAINFTFANLIGFNSSKVKGGEAINEFDVDLNKFNNFFRTSRFGLTFKF